MAMDRIALLCFKTANLLNLINVHIYYQMNVSLLGLKIYVVASYVHKIIVIHKYEF